MRMHLHQCTSDEDQAAWTVAHLRSGRSVSDVSLWTSGVDRPMRVVALVKTALRSQGIAVSKALRKVKDAEGHEHDVLTWFIQPTLSTTGQTA